ncbi:MAG: tetratricopeptide repeat protein [Burkholderiaceae bacterium]
MGVTNASEATGSVPGEFRMEVGEAVAFAMRRHQAGDLRQAQQIYEAVLERDPDRTDVLNVLGILKYQTGELDEAIALLRRVVAARPEADGTWNNLGNALLRKNEVDEAAQAFKRSLQLVPTAEAWANLARVFRRRGDLPVSEQACYQALALAPDHGVATHNLALALLGQRKVAEGVEAALRAMALLQPGERRRQIYVQLLQVAGETAQAAAILRAWQQQEPDNAYVRHHLAACTGDGVPARASDVYVEQEFDSFAASFDTTLARLNYRAPQVVADAVAAALPPPARQFDIVDLGCGTGLCGPSMEPWARQLVGCDLSTGMLMRASERGVYDELRKAELTAFLRERPGAFDVAISADTLNYFGELGEVALAVHGALRAGGVLVFTLEALAAGDTGVVRLQPHGRYAHDAVHARRVFADAGLAVDEPVGVVLREENQIPVQGWLIVARRGDR